MTATLVSNPNLFDFFRGRISASMERHAFVITEEASWYLASLLVDYSSTESLLDADGQPVTLAEMLYQARSADPSQAIQTYKRMGDYSLVVTGFFRRSLRSKPIDISYYQQMGGSAYRVLSQMVRSPGQTFADLFGELAERYGTASELLADVGETTKDRLDERDLLRLYEGYLETGCTRAATTLRAHGFRLDADPEDLA